MRRVMNAREVSCAKVWMDAGENVTRVSLRLGIDEDIIKDRLGIKPKRKPRSDKGVKRGKKHDH